MENKSRKIIIILGVTIIVLVIGLMAFAINKSQKNKNTNLTPTPNQLINIENNQPEQTQEVTQNELKDLAIVEYPNTSIVAPYSSQEKIFLIEDSFISWGDGLNQLYIKRIIWKMIAEKGGEEIIGYHFDPRSSLEKPTTYSRCCEKISPNGQWIFYERTPYIDRGGPVTTDILLNQTERGLGKYFPPGFEITEHTDSIDRVIIDAQWSPDSRYVSYLSGFGNKDVIFDTKTLKNALELKSKNTRQNGARPIAWLANNKISFVLDGNLWTGAIENPYEKLIAQNVENGQSFDEPGGLYLGAPLWSQNERYVTYSTKKEFIIFDSATNKKISLATSPNEEPFPYFSIFPIGWRDNSFFYISHDNPDQQSIYVTQLLSEGWRLEKIEMPDEKITQYSFDARYISPDGKYAVGEKVFLTENGNEVCPNLVKTLDYNFPGSELNDREWKKDYTGFLNLERENDSAVINLVDLIKCEKTPLFKGLGVKNGSIFLQGFFLGVR